MRTTSAPPERVYALWEAARRSYLRHGGMSLRFPADTDPTKTYQWRYLSSLHEKFDGWEFSDELRSEFIDIAVKYAKGRGLLGKGLSIFHQSNLINVCYAELRGRSMALANTLSSMQLTRDWLVAECKTLVRGDRSNDSRSDGDLTHEEMVAALSRRAGIGAYPGVVKWYVGSRLPELYLAVSRSCKVAMASLPAGDRARLPKDTRLYVLRMTVADNSVLCDGLGSILGDDWRTVK